MRRTMLTPTLFATLLTAAGCVGTLESGDDDPNPDPEPTASLGRQQYDREVATIMQSCGGCHEAGGSATPFLGAGGASDNYQVLTTTQRAVIGDFNPTQAPVLIYGVNPAHAGPEFTTAQAATVEDWLIQEAMDRGIDLSGEPPPTPTGRISSRQALAKFSACMNYGDWSANIGNLTMTSWANKNTNNGQQCDTCHAAGDGGLYTYDNGQMMFDMNRTELFMRAFFTTKPVNPADPNSDYMVVPNMMKLRSKGSGAGGLHPNYGVGENDPYFLRLQAFYDATMAGLAGCAAPPQFPQ